MMYEIWCFVCDNILHTRLHFTFAPSIVISAILARFTAATISDSIQEDVQMNEDGEADGMYT